jgi:hypothetical protein
MLDIATTGLLRLGLLLMEQCVDMITTKRLLLFFLLMVFLTSCKGAPESTPLPQALESEMVATALPTQSPAATETPIQATPTSALSGYAFPASIDPQARYLFYLHGKLIEDQGLPAISPEYGEYEYIPILEALEAGGYVVISEQRAAGTDSVEYAHRVAGQVTLLLTSGVSPTAIVVVGASQGAWIAIHVSHTLGNDKINYVLLSICSPETVQALIQDEIHLSGSVLSIYDAGDALAGSCQALFDYSEDKGTCQVEELVLQLGRGHGMLYQPLDEWVLPTLDWGREH